MCDHASNIMSDDIDWLRDVKMVLKEMLQIVGNQCFGVAVGRM